MDLQIEIEMRRRLNRVAEQWSDPFLAPAVDCRLFWTPGGWQLNPDYTSHAAGVDALAAARA